MPFTFQNVHEEFDNSLSSTSRALLEPPVGGRVADIYTNTQGDGRSPSPQSRPVNSGEILPLSLHFTPLLFIFPDLCRTK